MRLDWFTHDFEGSSQIIAIRASLVPEARSQVVLSLEQSDELQVALNEAARRDNADLSFSEEKQSILLNFYNRCAGPALAN